MIRSMSYSRYFRMATPMLTGMARIPANVTAARIFPNIEWPNGFPAAVARLTPASADPGQQPLPLLTALPADPPVAEHLGGHRHQPAEGQQREEQVIDRSPPDREAGGVVEEQQVAAGVHAGAVLAMAPMVTMTVPSAHRAATPR